MNVQITESGCIAVVMEPSEANVLVSVLGRVIDKTDDETIDRMYTRMLDQGVPGDRKVTDAVDEIEFAESGTQQFNLVVE